MNEDQMRDTLRKACDAAGSAAEWGRANGISAAYVGEVLAGTRGIGPKVLAALGYEQAPATYRRKVH